MLAVNVARGIMVGLCAITGGWFWSPNTVAQAARDAGHLGSDPWVLVCDRRSCIEEQRAVGTFFDLVYAVDRSPTAANNPYWFADRDWAALLAVSTARHDAVVAYQESLSHDLCMRAETIKTQAQLSAKLDESVSGTMKLTESYVDELSRVLSLEGRALVTRKVDELSTFIRTVNLDYATYFAAASIEPETYFESVCPPSLNRQLPRSAKPSHLPLAVFVSPECPTSVPLVRQVAEVTVSREGIEPLQWPALEEARGWFGAYIGLECVDDKHVLRLSLIDSLDGSLVLYRPGIDGSDNRGLAPPQSGNHASYASFLRDIVEDNVQRFLRARFEQRQVSPARD